MGNPLLVGNQSDVASTAFHAVIFMLVRVGCKFSRDSLVLFGQRERGCAEGNGADTSARCILVA
jgi:hypothetical protein